MNRTGWLRLRNRALLVCTTVALVAVDLNGLGPWLPTA